MQIERLAGEESIGTALAILRSLARHRDALADDSARVAIGGAGELVRRDRGHVDLEVDAIEERAADPRLVAQHRVGRAAAGSGRVASWPQGHGFMAATNWKSAGNSAWRAAREMTMRPVSIGSRKASSAALGNSGNSSRKRTP